MGWQGEVKRQGERQRVAAALGVAVERIRVYCWRSNQHYVIELDGERRMALMPRLRRDTLERVPYLGRA